MATPIHNREIPEGFTMDWDSTTWNVGFMFQWSDVFDGYLRLPGVVTVKPGDTLHDSLSRVDMDAQCVEVFFSVNH